MAIIWKLAPHGIVANAPLPIGMGRLCETVGSVSLQAIKTAKPIKSTEQAVIRFTCHLAKKE
jgi:hypothetical protein